MEKNYEKITDFIDDLMTDESITIARESSMHLGDVGSEFPFGLEDFRFIVSDLRNYESSSYKRKELKVPFTVVDYKADSETDHDHGAWTDLYVIDVEGRFYELEFDFYGQGDFDVENSECRGVREVFAKEITTTVYE
jgi:hypothetical protein